ncbi:MAG: hypothetical protein K9M45_01705 [Kiritimatiellales bacterium]|nr:hypothetical protein [Kiritimatiellales bacterium]
MSDINMMKRGLFILSTVLCATGLTADAAEYYVATNGSDGADGSFATPFATVQHAIDQLSGGDTLYLRGGTYHQETAISGIGVWTLGTGWDGRWEVTDGTSPPVLVSFNESNTLRLRDKHSVTRALATPITGGTLSFTWDADSLDSVNEKGLAEVYDGTWHTVWEVNTNGNGGDVENEPDALLGTNISLTAYGAVSQVRFALTPNTKTGDYLFVDDILVSDGGTEASDNFDGPATPMIIASYPGETALFIGTEPLTNNWTLHAGSIYKTTVSNDIWQLFVDGAEMVPARWPNAFLDDDFSPTVYSHDGFEGCTTFSDSGEPVVGGDGDVILNPGDVLLDVNSNVVVRSDVDLPGSSVTGAVAVMNIGSWTSWARTITEQPTNNAFVFQPQIQHHQLNAREQVFFLEGKLDFLDAQTEWFYDMTNKTVYLWMKGGGEPTGLIEGKVQSYAFTFDNCSAVELRGIGFFATTFRIDNSTDMLVEDCNLDFPITSRRMLGEPEAINVTSINADIDQWSPSRATLRNCTMRETDGPAFVMSGYGNTVDNCAFEWIDWTGAHGGGFTFGTGKSPGLRFRRNTVKTTGASEGVGCPKSVKTLTRNGDYQDVEPWLIAPYVTYEDLYPTLLELNHLSEMGTVQSDGAHIQAGSQQIPGLMYRYNWAYVSDKNGLRFDGGGGWDNAPPGVEGTQHHNVVFGTRKQSVKGDREYCFNNTCFDASQQDIYIGGNNPRFNAFNTRSKTGNNACNTISYDFTGPNGVFPGESISNYIGGIEGTDVKTLLVDTDQFDFRPKAGSPLVDGGAVEHGYTMEHFTNFLAPELFAGGLPTGNVLEYTNGITDGYVGAAPDIGAYEYGSDEYWIPGRKLAQASFPIPNIGSSDQPEGRALIFLLGYKGVSANIWFGTDPGSLQFLVNRPNPKNVIDPRDYSVYPPGSTTCYWRVDTVLGNGSVVPGEVWSYSTANYVTTPPGLVLSDDFESYTAGSGPTGDVWTTQIEVGDGTITVFDTGTNQTVRLFNTNAGSRTVFGAADLSISLGLMTVSFDSYVDDAVPVDGPLVVAAGAAGVNAGVNIVRKVDIDSYATTNRWQHFDWIVNQSGMSASYLVEGSPYVVSPGSADLWRNGIIVEDDGTSKPNTSAQTDTTPMDSFGWQINQPDTADWHIDNVEVWDAPHVKISTPTLFSQWAATNGVVNRFADSDNDGLNNLAEYALGGIPSVDDAATIRPFFFTEHADSINWFKYVYRRRSDYAARRLEYRIEQSTNLISGLWNMDGIEVAGIGPIDSGFESVTNHTPLNDKKKYLRLKILEQ